jgi:hypothetical protein
VSSPRSRASTALSSQRAALMIARPTSRLVNSVRHEGPVLLEVEDLAA